MAIKSWVVLWGQGNGSPCSMSGDLGQLRAEESRAAVESVHNASLPSFQCSFCKLIVILFFLIKNIKNNIFGHATWLVGS